MAGRLTSQTRFPTMKLPKAIVSIHNAIDAIEAAKKKRAALADTISDKKAALARLLKKNRKNLGVLPNKGIYYKFNGYVCQLTDDEKITVKIEAEA